MKKLISISALALGASLSVTAPAIPGGHSDGAVKARQAIMQLYAFNLGTLGGMAKGSVPYDAAAAQTAADNFLKAATMDQSAMWPEGTDSGSMPGKSRAKAEIWANFPDVAEKGKKLAMAATAMSEAAGKDLDSLKGAIGAIGASCGGCHKPYRAD